LDLDLRPSGSRLPQRSRIACFGDPGLHAARERAWGPLIGIAEAAAGEGVCGPGRAVVAEVMRLR